MLGVGHARIAGIGFGQGRELVRGRPIEVTRIDDETAHGDAVTTDPLGRRVDDDIGAVLERAVERRRGEGAVDHQRQARFLRHTGHGGNVKHIQTGVADDLAEDHAGIGLDRGADGVDVRAIDEGGGDAKARQGQLHQVDRPAVERLGRHDMVAGRKQRGDGQEHRCMPRGQPERPDPALERGDALFSGGNRGVADPGIEVPPDLEVIE